MKTFLFTMLLSVQALAVNQVIECTGGGVRAVSHISVDENLQATNTGNELSGIWTRPDAGPLMAGFVHVGPNTWSARGETVTQVVYSDAEATYYLQIPGNIAGTAFSGLKSVLVVEIEDHGHWTARNGYDVTCSSRLK